MLCAACSFDFDEDESRGRVVDRTAAHFSQGTISRVGSRMVVGGNETGPQLQLTDRLDANGDGYADLLVANHADKDKYRLNSYVYLGDAKGAFSASRRLELPTIGASFGLISDLNGDGRPDLVFSSWRDGKTFNNPSYIYWSKGGKFGVEKGSRKERSTSGGFGLTSTDLDRDGFLDLVISCSRDSVIGKSEIDSRIYWGPWNRSAVATNLRLELPTVSAVGNLAADLDRDGHPEVFFSNFGGKQSDLYRGPWSKNGGTTRKVPQQLPSVGGYMSIAQDPGAVADRRPRGVFTSRVLDSGKDEVSYAGLIW